MNNRLLENLSNKLGSQIPMRRYSLADMISESYKIMYECDGPNLKRLAESHLQDVKSNPKDIERLSRQLSIIRELNKLTESGQLKDTDLVDKKSYDTVAPKKERVIVHPKYCNESAGDWDAFKKSEEYKESYGDWVQYMKSEGYDAPFSKDEFEPTSACNDAYKRWQSNNKVDESRASRRTRRRMNESVGAVGAKVGDTIVDTKTGKEGKVQKLGQSGNYGLIYVDFGNGLRKINPMDDAQRFGRYTLKKGSVNEANDVDITDEELEKLTDYLDTIRKEKKNTPKTDMTESDEPEMSKRRGIRCTLKDSKNPKKEMNESVPSASDFLSHHDNPNNYRSNTKGFDKAYEILDKYGSSDEDVDKVYDRMPDEDKIKVYNYISGKSSMSESKKGLKENKFEVEIYVDDEYDRSKYFTDLKTARKWVDQFNYDAEIGTVAGEPHSVDESRSYRGLQNFKKQSESKAFYKTFKKMHESLKEGKALTRQESIALYKAANSALTQMSIELEHNPKFLKTFNESSSLLSKDVNSLRESLARGKAPSKKTMKSLAKFSEALLNESKLHVTIEDDGTRVDWFDTTEDEIFDDMKDYESKDGMTATVSGPGWSCSWEDYKADKSKSVNEATSDYIKIGNKIYPKDASNYNYDTNPDDISKEATKRYNRDARSERISKRRDEKQSQIVIEPISGINSDGAKVKVLDGEGTELFKKEYRYGTNASWKRSHNDKENTKPYIGDIIKELSTKYDVPVDDIEVIPGTYVFSGKKMSADDVDKFIQNYMSESKKVNEAEDEDDEDLDDIEAPEDDFVGDDEGDMDLDPSEFDSEDQAYADEAPIEDSPVDDLPSEGDESVASLTQEYSDLMGRIQSKKEELQMEIQSLDDISGTSSQEDIANDMEGDIVPNLELSDDDTEDDESDEESEEDEDITDDELEELKKHLKEMRSAKKGI